MKILAPVDQSHRDGITLPYCVKMAKALNATVAAVEVVPLTRTFIPGAVRETEAYIDAVVMGLREQGVGAEGIVRRGDPAGVIISLASELPADLIIMTTHGRKGLGKLVLGSIADAVLTHCHKPVLLLSEVANGALSDEKVRRQSAYLATVIWRKQARGLITAEEANQQIEILAAAGLDRTVLFSAYENPAAHAGSFDWLDLDFQLRTLQLFLPEEVPSLVSEQPPQFRGRRAA